MRKIKKLLYGTLAAMTILFSSARATEVRVPVSSDSRQNALNWKNVVSSATQDITAILPNAIYDLQENNPIPIYNDNPECKITCRGETNPIPQDWRTADLAPATGAIVKSNIGVDDNITLENIFFDLRELPIYHGSTINHVDNIEVNNCYFYGNRDMSSAYSAGLPADISSNVFTGNFFRGYKYGLGVDTPRVKLRDNVFMENKIGVYLDGNSDLGTELDPGNNCFIGNELYAIKISRGATHYLQWGYFYDSEGEQADKIEIVRDLIWDTRIPSATTSRHNLTGDLEGVFIEPFHTDSHPLFPLVTGVDDWKWYK